MKKIFLSVLFVLAFSTAHSQFILKGEYRPRFEFRDGYSKLNSQGMSPVWIITQRTRLTANYKTGMLEFGMGIQDVRVWGEEELYSATGVFGDKSSIDLNEAWFTIKLPKDNLIRIGRQYLYFEDERLISRRSWNQNELKYDALFLQHKTENFRIDLALSWNNIADNSWGNDYPANRMRTLNYIYFRNKLTNWLDLSACAIASGFTKNDSSEVLYVMGSYGFYLNAGFDRFNANASVYYQNGRNRSGMRQSAYMLSVRGNYKLGKLSLGAGLDYLSGDNASSTNTDYLEKEHSFDILYGARHRYYGNLDYFNNLQKATGSGGLIDPFLQFKWAYHSKSYLNLDLHYFLLQNEVRDPYFDGTGKTYLASELGPEADLSISWDMFSIVNLKGGYSILLPTASMEKLQGINPANNRIYSWVWMMLTVKPFFTDQSGK